VTQRARGTRGDVRRDIAGCGPAPLRRSGSCEHVNLSLRNQASRAGHGRFHQERNAACWMPCDRRTSSLTGTVTSICAALHTLRDGIPPSNQSSPVSTIALVRSTGLQALLHFACEQT
jgi:hypothetical protein